MTDRGLPIVDGAPACPFVAYEDDRDGRGQAPDHRHRCFAEARPAPRALAHQEAYCLSSAFPVCPTFQDWARREAATARAQQERDEELSEQPPVSQPMPPPELEPLHAPPGTDTSASLPPRRNPPRAWAAPPPWTGDTDGESAEPPPFLADRPVDPSMDRAAEAAAWGAASRGLAGSAADRLAGPYSDEVDGDEPHPVPVAAASPDPGDPYERDSYERDPYERNAYERPPAVPSATPDRSSTAAAGAAGAAAAAAVPPGAADRARAAPPASRSASASSSSDRTSAATPRPRPQDPSELFGPAWERPRRYEAYPSLRTRVGLPSIGVPSRLGVAAIALVLAAVVLFFVGPMILGIGGKSPGGAGSTAAPPAEEVSATPLPTQPPAPTQRVYVVARGDTMLKIARKFHVTVEQLLAANPKIKNPNRIAIGDEITIPVPEADAGSAAP